MGARFEPVAFDAIREAVVRHMGALPGPTDSYLDDQILGSAHYRIVVDGEPAGIAAIHEERLITLFALEPPFRRHGSAIFARLRRQEQVGAALVPTADEFYLAHALDDYRLLARQAYQFAAPEGEIAAPAGYALRPASADDAALIRAESGDFFEPLDRYLGAGELFLTVRAGETVGFGLAAASALRPGTASIGMFTPERHRRGGVGTATIALLIARCRERDIRPVAGCWYYNHRSKATLERAGMVAQGRLLRIEY